MEGKVMAQYEPQTAKKVYLYRNGTVNKDAKLMVVNDRQVRDFGTFLNRVTSGIRAPVAVRNIYTPSQGHKICSIEQLVSGKYYVAGGSEQFKRVRYGSGPKLLPRRQPRIEVSPTHRNQQMVVAKARYKQPVEKPSVIHVFRNGDELFRGVRVLLPRRIMGSWEHVLEIVTEKADLNTPAKRLCTLDGHAVHAVTELQDGGKYVAIEGSRAFRRVAYCATQTIAARRRRNATLTLPILTKRWTKQSSYAPHLSLPPISDATTAVRPQPPPVDPMSQLVVPQHHRRKLRPMAGRKNKEARERALLENRDDSVFGGSPVLYSREGRMPSPPLHTSTTSNLLQGLASGAQKKRHVVGKERQTPSPGGEAEGGYVARGDVKDNGEFVSGEGHEMGSTEEGGLGLEEGGIGRKRVERARLERGQGYGTEEKDEKHRQRGSGKRAGKRDPTQTEAASIPKQPLPLPAMQIQVSGTRESDAVEDEGRQVEEILSPSSGLDNEGVQSEQREDEIIVESLVEEEEVDKGEGDKVKPENKILEDRKVEAAAMVEGQVEMAAIPEEAVVERNVDQTDPEEVLEEDEEEGEGGGATRSEVKEEVEMKMLPQEVELESQPLQTSVDLTMTRKQQSTAISATNEGSSRNSPLQSGSAESSSANVHAAVTESGHVGSVKGKGVGSVNGGGVGGGGGGGVGDGGGEEEMARRENGSPVTAEQGETETEIKGETGNTDEDGTAASATSSGRLSQRQTERGEEEEEEKGTVEEAEGEGDGEGEQQETQLEVVQGDSEDQAKQPGQSAGSDEQRDDSIAQEGTPSHSHPPSPPQEGTQSPSHAPSPPQEGTSFPSHPPSPPQEGTSSPSHPLSEHTFVVEDSAQ